MGQTNYPTWESEVDTAINRLIIANFGRLEAAQDESENRYKEIWEELSGQLFDRYSLQGKSASGDREAAEKAGYVQSRIAFFRDREFPYLQGDAQREFILTMQMMPDGTEWDKFVREAQKERPPQEDFSPLFG